MGQKKVGGSQDRRPQEVSLETEATWRGRLSGETGLVYAGLAEARSGSNGIVNRAYWLIGLGAAQNSSKYRPNAGRPVIGPMPLGLGGTPFEPLGVKRGGVIVALLNRSYEAGAAQRDHPPRGQNATPPARRRYQPLFDAAIAQCGRGHGCPRSGRWTVDPGCQDEPQDHSIPAGAAILECGLSDESAAFSRRMR